jgi:hypothetical protein
MSTNFQGGCACGEIRYEASEEPFLVAHCHCRDCQRTSGAAFVTTAFMRKINFKLLRGTPRSCEFRADSGNILGRQFCGTCGSQLFFDVKAMPEIWGIKVTSLDDSSWVQPMMHVWVRSAQSWDKITDALPQYDRNPPIG